MSFAGPPKASSRGAFGRGDPKLCVNATGLNAGGHWVFCSDPAAAGVPAWLGRFGSPLMALGALFRTRPYEVLPCVLPVARAVTASSALPLVFTPLRIERAPSGTSGTMDEP